MQRIPIMVRSLVLMIVGLALVAGSARPCSTVLLAKGQTLLVGHNLDAQALIPGRVYVNKRGLRKAAVSWNSLVSGEPDATPPLTWTSKYASVTFNPFGRDFPDDGMNEAGLFVGEMSLPGTRFPVDAARPTIFMSLWMQYLLDTAASIDEVIASASALSIDGWAWHFFTADRSGRSASIEFLDGKVVVHAGTDMPVTALCNSGYDDELERLKLYQGFGGDKPLSLDDAETPRFVHAARMLKDFEPASGEPVDYAFRILKRLERGGTQWSFVCDLKGQTAWFRSAASANVKRLDLKAFDLDCGKPALWVDLHADRAGDVSGLMREYSLEANRAFCREATEAILKITSGPKGSSKAKDASLDGQIERMASYPGRATCSR